MCPWGLYSGNAVVGVIDRVSALKELPSNGKGSQVVLQIQFQLSQIH